MKRKIVFYLMALVLVLAFAGCGNATTQKGVIAGADSQTGEEAAGDDAFGEDVEEIVREAAVKVYSAIGCQGLSRVDFFVTYDENRVVFNEINTLPGFTSISMYPKLFGASGVPYTQLIDNLLQLAMEAF